MSDYDRFKKDHPEMMKMAEEHLEETEALAGEVNRLSIKCAQAIELLRELRDSYRDLHQDREHEENCAGCERLRKADELLGGRR